MTYDKYGNILTKNGKTYTYDATWKDLLTKYNNQTITYDTQGNPTTYLGKTLTWEKGRQLKTYGSNSYSYNNNGIRIEKRENGNIHTYTLDGTNIVKEVVTDAACCPKYTNEYLYDIDGTVCGLKYNGTAYYFYKNLQGDVIAIADDTGAVKATYTYDAWGKCTTVSDTSGCNIAEMNPFRYRGYYYDTETDLYYLQSRYYDPEVGRFINADDSIHIFEAFTLLSFDLYTYCENNLINGCDSNGRRFIDFVKSVVRSVVNITRKVVHTVVATPTFVEITQQNKMETAFDIAGFFQDSSGIYHTKQMNLQHMFGYNDLYDMLFYLGTSMKRAKFQFSFKGEDLIFWAWKGDYLNLGAGAELGIYRRFSLGLFKTKHWLAGMRYAMRMELNLKYKGNTIISYKPSEKQWWITGFNPYHQNINADQLSASYKVYFDNKNMYNSFYYYQKKNSRIHFNSNNKSAVINL